MPCHWIFWNLNFLLIFQFANEYFNNPKNGRIRGNLGAEV
ncbi:hypothetical protein C943_03507 [Mariniradius saccharolyticus AK6]|uniref:Uncharacterized protein n=1 Tax=Mariniradius saccharolyticus AK6 TaxID=1239962 RepID=M7XIC0_9BACT|nr:hypothetical protein C943_03507 [Mariniradius saccharolyticus AK6]